MRLSGMDERLRNHAEDTIAYAHRLGIDPIVTSVRRNEAEQRKLYAVYTSGRSRYPASPPGQSSHQYGVAFDTSVPAHQLATWTAVRRAFGWLAPDSDTVHAEWPGWRSYVSDLRYS